MSIRTVGLRIALLAATAAVGMGSLSAPAAVAATPPSTAKAVGTSDGVNFRSASGSTDHRLWTNNGAGSIQIHWTWHLSASGRSYYGSFSGTFYDHKIDGKYVLLQAKWQGQNWTPIRTAANGGSFKGDYSGLNGLNFRACLQGGNCGRPAW